jgi:hypothetical protein
MQNKHTNEKNDDMNLKSKSSHPKKYGMMTLMMTLVISFNPITNTLNTEKYDLKNDFIIQSCNAFDHKT